MIGWIQDKENILIHRNQVSDIDLRITLSHFSGGAGWKGNGTHRPV